MNIAHFTGRFVDDPTLERLEDGKQVTDFRLEVERIVKKQQNDGNFKARRDTSILDFQAWDSGAELIVRNFRKGDLIVIEDSHAVGDPYIDKDGRPHNDTYFRVNQFSSPKTMPRSSQCRANSEQEAAVGPA